LHYEFAVHFLLSFSLSLQYQTTLTHSYKQTNIQTRETNIMGLKLGAGSVIAAILVLFIWGMLFAVKRRTSMSDIKEWHKRKMNHMTSSGSGPSSSSVGGMRNAFSA
jgi:hypothetical protein